MRITSDWNNGGWEKAEETVKKRRNFAVFPVWDGIREILKIGEKTEKKEKKTFFFKKKGIFFIKNAVFDLTEWILKCIVHILQLKE